MNEPFMTQLYFRYSEIYDRNLTGWTGAIWDIEDAAKGYKFANEVQPKWNEINDTVFDLYETFGLKLADFWLAYPVTRRKGILPFADPLTFWMHDDQNMLFSTLIHELAHVELSYYANQDIAGKIWNYISTEFADSSEMTRGHIIVNVLQWAVMEALFGTKLTENILTEEKDLEGLAEAWTIIDSQKDAINLSDPMGSILALKKLTN